MVTFYWGMAFQEDSSCSLTWKAQCLNDPQRCKVWQSTNPGNPYRSNNHDLDSPEVSNFNDKKMQSRAPKHGRQPRSWTYQSPCNAAWKPLPGFWPSEFRRSSLYHCNCNCICFFQMQLSYQAYPIYPHLSRSWSTCWGLWLKINVSWNMLDNVRPTPHVRPPGGGSLSLLVRRIFATADWNAIAWSEKTMNKQQINGSRFRWRTKSLCLIDLNGKAFFNKCLPLSSNALVLCLAQLAVNTPSPIKMLSGADSGSTFQVDDVPQEGLFWSGNHTKVPLGYCGQVASSFI